MGRFKVSLVLAGLLLFAATIWGFLHGFPTLYIILLFSLHSLCLIVLAFLFSMDRNDYTAAEEAQQELAVLRSQSENEKNTMQKALDAAEKELAVSREEREVLRDSVTQKEQRVEELKEEVRSARTQIEELMTDINDFLPPVDEAPKMVDIIRVARETAEELEKSAQKEGITVRISSSQEMLYVKAEPQRLRIMFRNIIDNSLKYMRRSGSLVITISAIEQDIFIVLKDTGEGLPEEETKHIFELNFQGSNRISGNGLGLTQAKAIVDYYGGTIYGKSSPGKGMGIYIQLPMNSQGVPAASAADHAQEAEPSEKPEPAEKDGEAKSPEDSGKAESEEQAKAPEEADLSGAPEQKEEAPEKTSGTSGEVTA